MDLDQLDYQGIIFDFDGTLANLNVNYSKLKLQIQAMVIKVHNIQMDFTPILVQLSKLEKIDKKIYKSALELIKKAEKEALKSSIINEKLLNSIKNTKKRLAIFSLNFKETIEAFLRNHNIKNIDIIIGNQEVIKYKPDSEGLVKILKHWGLNKKEVIFIGDSINDRLAGESIGVNTILI